MDKREASCRRLLLVGALLFAALAALARGQEQITVESRDLKPAPSGENELSDTLKYLEKLEKLDQYWSEVARPRFGRSEYKQPMLTGLRFQRQWPASARQLERPHAFQLPNGGARQNGLARTPLSLADLVNLRLEQRYNSNEAY